MVLLAANCIPVVVNHLLMTFYAVKTPHNCRVSYFKIFAVGCGTIFRLGAAGQWAHQSNVQIGIFY